MLDVAGSPTHVNQNASGPNYFGYYKNEILQIFSQNEDLLLPLNNKYSESRTDPEVKVEDAGNGNCIVSDAKSCGSFVSLGGGIEEVLSDFKKEKLKSTLKHSLKDLNHEVDDILDEILVINQLRAHQKDKMKWHQISSGSDKETSRHFCKRQKILFGVTDDAGGSNLVSPKQVSKDFQLLEEDRLQSEDAFRKFADELFAKVVYMEKHIEDFLNIVMSKCREMTRIEKQQLCKRIQKIPAEALEHVVEIITHRKSSKAIAFDEIHVNLEEEDTSTLWRLHYFMEAVEIANSL